MTSDTKPDVLPEDDTRAPINHDPPKEFDQLDAARAHIGRLGDEVAKLIKQRDEAREELKKGNRENGLLQRTVTQLSSLLADADVEKLEVKLELAKDRARLARKIARDAGGEHVDVFAFVTTTAKANGKDA